jgi:hypothetical protein
VTSIEVTRHQRMHTSLTYVNVLGSIGDMPKTRDSASECVRQFQDGFDTLRY